MRSKARLVVVSTLLALPLFAGPPPSPSPTPAVGETGVAWKEITFRARKFFLSAETTLSVRAVPASAVKDLVRDAGEGATPIPATLVELSVTTDLPFGREEEVRTWLDPATGAAIQTDKTVLGRKPYRKVFRYWPNGYHMRRSSPATAAEEAEDPSKWTHVWTKDVRAAGSIPPGTVLTDSYALLYLAAAARLDRPGSELHLAIFSDDRAVGLDFAGGGLTVFPVEYEAVRAGTRTTERGRPVAREITVTGRVLDGSARADDVDMGFMGMKGELVIYVEKGTGLPLELDGRTDAVGKLRVILSRAVF